METEMEMIGACAVRSALAVDSLATRGKKHIPHPTLNYKNGGKPVDITKGV